MKRSVIPSICLMIALVVSGCTKSPPPTEKKAPPPATDSGSQAPETGTLPQEGPAVAPTAPVEKQPAMPVEEKPAAAQDQPATQAAAGAAAQDQPDMTPPADATPPAPKLPYEDLVAALNIDQATQAYRDIEAQIAQNPQDTMLSFRLISLLNTVGMRLANTGNNEKALEAYLAAAEKAKSVENPPDDMARLQLAQFQSMIGTNLAKVGNKEKSIEALQAAFDRSKTIQNPADMMLRVQLAYIQNTIGMGYAAAGSQEKAIEVFSAAMDHAQAVPVDPQQPLPEEAQQMLSIVYYNGACAQSLSGKPEDAKATLQKAIDMGYSDLESLRNDPDMAAVRALPDFEQAMTAWQASIIQKVLSEDFPFDFSVTDYSGQNVSLAGLQGKVVIVDLWGTWCPPCRAEIPSFVKLQTEYGPQGLQIVGFNEERGKPEPEVKELTTKFIQDNGINYPCAMLTEDIQRQVPNFNAFPTTLFIDRTGKVRGKLVGGHDYAFLESLVKFLLAETAPPPAAPADTPPAAPADTPPAAPADTPPAAPADTPPAGSGT